MRVTGSVRAVILESGQTHYRIAKETGINTTTLDRFVHGGADPKGNTIDKLCEYFGLELVRKKQRTGTKQATKKPTKTARKKK